MAVLNISSTLNIEKKVGQANGGVDTYCSSCHEDIREIACEATLLVGTHLVWRSMSPDATQAVQVAQNETVEKSE